MKHTLPLSMAVGVEVDYPNPGCRDFIIPPSEDLGTVQIAGPSETPYSVPEPLVTPVVEATDPCGKKLIKETTVTYADRAESGLVFSHATGDQPIGVTIYPTNGNIWTTNYAAGTVSKVSYLTGVKVDYPAPAQPLSISADTTNGLIWVACRDSNTLSKFNEATGARTDYVGITDGTYLTACVYDAAENCVWVNGYANNKLYKVSINGVVLAEYTVGMQPYSVCVDSTSGTVWTGNTGGASKLVKSTGVVTSVLFGTTTAYLASDGAGSIWGVGFNATDYVWQIDIATVVVTQLSTQGARNGLAWDDTHNLLYWSSSSTNSLVSYDPSNGNTVVEATVSGAAGIKVSSLGTVWCTASNADAVVAFGTACYLDAHTTERHYQVQ